MYYYVYVLEFKFKEVIQNNGNVSNFGKYEDEFCIEVFI